MYKKKKITLFLYLYIYIYIFYSFILNQSLSAKIKKKNCTRIIKRIQLRLKSTCCWNRELYSKPLLSSRAGGQTPSSPREAYNALSVVRSLWRVWGSFISMAKLQRNKTYSTVYRNGVFFFFVCCSFVFTQTFFFVTITYLIPNK